MFVKLAETRSNFFPDKHFHKGSVFSDTVLLWNCFMSRFFFEPDYKQNLFPVSNVARRTPLKPIFRLNAPNYQLIALPWCNWLMHLPGSKTEGNSADNYKLSSGFWAIYTGNRILDMFNIYPSIRELTKPTSQNSIFSSLSSVYSD